MERTKVERCALSGSDLKIKFRTILLTSIVLYYYIISFLVLLVLSLFSFSLSFLFCFCFYALVGASL